jgi:hypothetical protein
MTPRSSTLTVLKEKFMRTLSSCLMHSMKDPDTTP